MVKVLLIISALSFLMSCQSEPKNPNPIPLDRAGSSNVIVTNRQFKKEEVQKILQELPTPYKLALLFAKESKLCPTEYLGEPKPAELYPTKWEKALLVGIYSADQAFASICAEKEIFIKYSRAEMELSKSLNLPIFEEALLDSIQSVQGGDTLQRIYQDLFISKNLHLKTEADQEKAIWIATTSWVESMFLGSKMVIEKADSYKKLIAEQKKNLNLLLRLWNSIDVKADDALQDRLEVLSAIYEKVEFTAGKKGSFLLIKEPVVDSTDIISENIRMSIPVMEAIENELASIRNFVIKNGTSKVIKE